MVTLAAVVGVRCGAAAAGVPPRCGPGTRVPFICPGGPSHGKGHDYPQFLADWSKLTDKGALVDGSFHFPAQELATTDVMVICRATPAT
jgi:hypothetical protein